MATIAGLNYGRYTLTKLGRLPEVYHLPSPNTDLGTKFLGAARILLDFVSSRNRVLIEEERIKDYFASIPGTQADLEAHKKLILMHDRMLCETLFTSLSGN